ncbi:MAG: ATP-binding cassette domain-containing protein [Deferribacterota bacterium]|nr:ATP-binding cassette domain-containing protein [Deferribacterota bacterium]
MISAHNLTKYYGRLKAVDKINFNVDSGEIVGFLGPNGAGKTTTMQILTGYLAPTDGEAYISGLNIQENPLEVKQLIGYLPENNPLYSDMFVFDYLIFISQLKDIPSHKRKKRILDVSEVCSITDILNRKIEQLSKGYRQRVGLAASIIGDPDILILDEPTVGLDPNQIIEIRNLIKRLGSEKTIILSTHILQEVEQTCNRVLIINNGKIIKDSQLDKLIKETNQFIIETEPKIGRNILDQIGKVKKEKGNRFVIESDSDIRRKLSEICLQNKILILELTQYKKSLEDVFKELTQEDINENL